MEKCRYCEAELEENSTVCPACGKDNAVCATEAADNTEVAAPAETEAACDAAEEKAEDTGVTAEADEETAETEETPDENKEEASEETVPKKKFDIEYAMVFIVIALVAALMCTMVIRGAKGSLFSKVESNKVTCRETYTVSDEAAAAAHDAVVAQLGDKKLTNGQLQVYYWISVNSFFNQYGGYAAMMGLDYQLPLDEQQCGFMDEPVTWQQYFLDTAMSTWANYQSIASTAEKNGFQLPEEYRALIDGTEEEMEKSALEAGFSGAEEMLRVNFGPGVTVDDYKAYREVYFLGYSYYMQETAKISPSDAEVEAYFTEHEAEFAENGVTKDTRLVDVRHILILPKGASSATIRTETFSEEAWAEGKAEAEEILAEWLAGEHTEESFAKLAGDRSRDVGSQTTGGLYEGVYEGQMVPNFNDWIFDASRKTGDYDIVETEFGYHIMYFVRGYTVWQDYARSELEGTLSEELADRLIEGYELKPNFSKVKIGFVDLAA